MENLLDFENVESDNRNSCMLNSTFATREKLYTVLYISDKSGILDLRWIRCEGGSFSRLSISSAGECFDRSRQPSF